MKVTLTQLTGAGEETYSYWFVRDVGLVKQTTESKRGKASTVLESYHLVGASKK